MNAWEGGDLRMLLFFGPPKTIYNIRYTPEELQKYVDLIPEEDYVKGLLCDHEVALYIRRKGLR